MSNRALSDVDGTPTAGMVSEAIKGLDWRKEFGRGGTQVGVSRARDIKNKTNLSVSTIKRMFSFFSRHEVDKKAEGFRPGEKGYPSNGRIAWALWGGDAGFSWSKKKMNQIRKEEDRALTGPVKKALEKKVKDHNEEVKDLSVSWNPRVTLAKLEKVFDRGVGAYKTSPGSVRPSVNSPEQWAYARVNSFLYALKKGKFRRGKHDTDLLPAKHPEVIKMKEEQKNIMENLDKRHIKNVVETEDTYIITYEKPKEAQEPMEDSEKDQMEKQAYEEQNEFDKSGEDMRTIMNDKEVRHFTLSDIEVREEGENKVVVGYGSVFNSLSNNLGGFREIIHPRAFEGRLEDDVRFLFNHDANLVLARTTNQSLRLRVDEKGLRYEAVMPNTSTARDLMELMNNGTINQSSFAFVVEDDSWEQTSDGTVRTINKVSRLYDVSAVTYPAYEDASVALRSMETWKNDFLAKQAKKEKEENKREEMDLHRRSLASLKMKLNKLKN